MSYAADKNQADALRRIRDHGCLAWCEGKGRAGGAVSRLFDRMAKDGYCTRAPHEITKKGRAWLDEYDRNFPPKCLHCRKPRSLHTATQAFCPIGSKHRTLGYTQFGSTTFYHPQVASHKGQAA